MFDAQNFGGFAAQPSQDGFWTPSAGGFPHRAPQRQQNAFPWIFVPLARDAANVSVPPGQTAWIMAQNESAFAVRAADATGVTTTRYYRFEEFDGSATAGADYVTRKEFETVIRQLMAGKESADEQPAV